MRDYTENNKDLFYGKVYLMKDYCNKEECKIKCIICNVLIINVLSA